MEEYNNKIEKFKKMPHYPQRSKEWLEQRNNYFTASAIYKVLSFKGVNYLNILKDKITYGKTNSFFGNNATHWGNKFEPVAQEIYRHRNDYITINEFGLITNEKYKHVAISPDGIMYNKLLEIKCPYSRIIKDAPLPEYYAQVQLQLCICEFDICDFLQCKFINLEKSDFIDNFDKYVNEKGIIITYLNERSEISYLYSPIIIHKDTEALNKWYADEMELLKTKYPNDIYVDTIYWTLDVYSCIIINRDPEWINKYYDIILKSWEIVEKYRILGLEQFEIDYNIKSNTENCSSPLINIDDEANESRISNRKLLGKCLL